MQAPHNIPEAPANRIAIGARRAEPAPAATHTTVITSDSPVEVRVATGPGYWFKVWMNVIESGAWAKLSPAASKVYIPLARYANGNPALACWPSSSTLERDSGLSRSAVFRALAELVAAGLVVRRLSGGGTTTTTFQLMEPRGSGPGAPQSTPMPAAMTPPPTRPRNGTGTPPTRPIPATPPVPEMGRDLDPGIKNNSSSSGGSSIEPTAESLRRLRAEGFSPTDVRSLAEHGADRVDRAITNCDSLQRRGKLRGERRAYIACAIRNDYTLSEAAERDLWPAAAEELNRKLSTVCTEDDAERLRACYGTPLGVLKARAVSVDDVRALAPSDLLHRLLNRGRASPDRAV